MLHKCPQVRALERITKLCLALVKSHRIDSVLQVLFLRTSDSLHRQPLLLSIVTHRHLGKSKAPRTNLTHTHMHIHTVICVCVYACVYQLQDKSTSTQGESVRVNNEKNATHKTALAGAHAHPAGHESLACRDEHSDKRGRKENTCNLRTAPAVISSFVCELSIRATRVWKRLRPRAHRITRAHM